MVRMYRLLFLYIELNRILISNKIRFDYRRLVICPPCLPVAKNGSSAWHLLETMEACQVNSLANIGFEYDNFIRCGLCYKIGCGGVYARLAMRVDRDGCHDEDANERPARQFCAMSALALRAPQIAVEDENV